VSSLDLAALAKAGLIIWHKISIGPLFSGGGSATVEGLVLRK